MFFLSHHPDCIHPEQSFLWSYKYHKEAYKMLFHLHWHLSSMLLPDFFRCHRSCTQHHLITSLFQKNVLQVRSQCLLQHLHRWNWLFCSCCPLLKQCLGHRSTHAYPVLWYIHFHQLPDEGYKHLKLLFQMFLLFHLCRSLMFLQRGHLVLLTQILHLLLEQFHLLQSVYSYESQSILNQNMDPVP